ncbi:MAG: hypothetical protein AAF533_03960 [Acidobacteriota bacterium]
MSRGSRRSCAKGKVSREITGCVGLIAAVITIVGFITGKTTWERWQSELGEVETAPGRTLALRSVAPSAPQTEPSAWTAARLTNATGLSVPVALWAEDGRLQPIPMGSGDTRLLHHARSEIVVEFDADPGPSRRPVVRSLSTTGFSSEPTTGQMSTALDNVLRLGPNGLIELDVQP